MLNEKLWPVKPHALRQPVLFPAPGAYNIHGVVATSWRGVHDYVGQQFYELLKLGDSSAASRSSLLKPASCALMMASLMALVLRSLGCSPVIFSLRDAYLTVNHDKLPLL